MSAPKSVPENKLSPAANSGWRHRLQQNAMLAKLMRNIGWNLLGQVAPLLTALVAIPILIKGIGNERFGLLSIGWMLVGYFSFFDFGLGRALTQVLAQKLATTRPADTSREQWQREQTQLIWSGMLLMLGLGCVVALLLALTVTPLVSQVLNVPPALQAEARAGIWWLVLALPSVVVATGLRGVLEAHHAFKLLNLVRTPLGVLTFAGPLLVLPWSQRIDDMFAVLCLVRYLTTILFLLACQRVQGGFWQIGFARELLPDLLRFSGWMTVSNIVGPLMINLDRLLIGALLSLAAVTHYTTPFEMMTRMLVLPGAVAGVYFPLFAQHWKLGELAQMRRLLWQGTRYLGLLMAAISAVVLVFAPLILQLWLSPEFAEKSSTVLRLLAVGVLLNGLANLPYALVQGMGRSKVTAQFHLFECVCYLPLLYLLLKLWGINGVALAWVLRVALDCGLLYAYAARHLAGGTNGER
ncbi:MAG: flippase [Burkholderiales bacterium]|nr:flippase [Burkholderiales bacterium]